MPKSGYISASSFDQLMKKTDIAKNQFGDGCMTLAHKIVCERLNVEIPEAFGAALDWGNEYEYNAREEYEQREFCKVVVPKFISILDTMVGGTPDGLVGDDGILEIKCPHNPVNHLENILTASQYHEKYKAQCQGYLWITGRKWVDFASYDPRFPEDKTLVVHRFERDDEYISTLSKRVELFEQIILDILKQLQ